MGDGQDQGNNQAAAPLPTAVVSPEEQLNQAGASANLSNANVDQPLRDDTAAAKDNLPPIPDDATLDSKGIYELAKAHNLPGNSLEEDRALLKKSRDGVQLQSIEHPGAPFPDEDFDPTNPREFDPTVVLLHLERDGVIVEGFINPFTGAGCQDLLVRLQDELVKARAREDGAAPAHVQVGEAPDPNALKRQRATAAGHDIDPETKRCRNCHNAEWWCLEGNPCEPREDAAEPAATEEPVNGEADSENP